VIDVSGVLTVFNIRVFPKTVTFMLVAKVSPSETLWAGIYATFAEQRPIESRMTSDLVPYSSFCNSKAKARSRASYSSITTHTQTPDDGGSKHLLNMVNFYHTTRRNIPTSSETSQFVLSAIYYWGEQIKEKEMAGHEARRGETTN
jgi:hypothetical protein